MKKSQVAIVRVTEDAIDQAVEELFSLLGGIHRFLLPLDTVLLKPNWVTDKHYSTGAVTHTGLLRAVAGLLLQSSAKKVLIGDSSMVGKKTEDAICVNGVDSLASRRVEIVDFKKSEYIRVAVPNALRYPRLSLPRELMESDWVLNLPVMKTHDAFPVTLGLKNMKGLLPDREKRRFHLRGLDEGVIDLNRAARANFTLIDGIIGMEGNGPVNGTPAHAGVLIASEDALAAEVAAIAVMGFDAREFPYITMAYEAGLGQMEFDKMDLLGVPINEVVRPFQSSFHTQKQRGAVTVDDDGACSGCRDAIVQFLTNNRLLEQNPTLSLTIVAGGVPCGESRRHSKPGEGWTIGIGKCTQASRDRFDAFVPGCAPMKMEMDKAYQSIVEKSRKEKEASEPCIQF